MKYVFPALLVLVILAGLTLTLTPFIAEQLFPVTATRLRSAQPEQVKQALAEWFDTKPGLFKQARGIKRLSAQNNISWFTFQVERKPVENFIRKNRLKQQPLTQEIMHDLFSQQQPPAEWWQPRSLRRETYFVNQDSDQQIGLIYNAENQTGFLVVRTRQKTHDF